MTVRIPLVLVNGQIQQLQSGDTIVTAASTYQSMSLQNADSVSINCGMAVYMSAAGAVKRAVASSLTTCGGTIGIVLDATIASSANGNIVTEGLVTLTTTQWDAVGGSSGLSFGSTYYIDPSTPGNITTTAPTTVGQVVVPIGVAISAVTLKVEVGEAILL
jgi:hypothetical protein